MTAAECDCSEEYGPCEQHGEVIVQREGGSARTADELQVIFVEDAVDAGVELSPWGRAALLRAQHNLDANRSAGVAWFSDDGEGSVISHDISTLVDQAESDLATMDEPIYTFWDDGYRMVRIIGGPLKEDERRDLAEFPVDMSYGGSLTTDATQRVEDYASARDAAAPYLSAPASRRPLKED